MSGAHTLLSAFLVIGGLTAYAQQSAPDKPKTLKATGTVKAYEAGKTIEVEAKGAPHTYDLSASETTYTISPDVAVGSKVKPTEKTDSAGRKMVRIETSGKSPKPAAEKSERPMSEKPP